MRISDFVREWFFGRCARGLMGAETGGGSGSGASEGGAAAAAAEGNGFDAALLSNLPGGEMLAGAVANRPEAPAEVRDWEPGDAERDDEEESGKLKAESGNEAGGADEAAEGKDEEAEKTGGDEDEDGDEDDEAAALRTRFEEVAAERDALKAEVETSKAQQPEPVLAPSARMPLAHVSSEEGLGAHA